MEFGFTSGAGSVAPGDTSGVFDLAIELQGTPTVSFDESNDYSWQNGLADGSLQPNFQITAYINGELTALTGHRQRGVISLS